MSNPLTQTVQKALAVPGLSDTGAAWLAKALHPADAVVKCVGIPSSDVVPTAPLNFMTTTTIAAPAAAAWSAHVTLNPSPIYFAAIHSSDGVAFGHTVVYNPQLTATAFDDFGANARTYATDAMTAWTQNVRSHRLMYASMTVTLSANAQNNQGTVTCAQYDQRGFYAFCPNHINLTQNPVVHYAPRQLRAWPLTNLTQAQLQAMPGATTWEARKGIYQVLKITPEGILWHDAFNIDTQVSTSASPCDYQLTAANVIDWSAAAAPLALAPPFGPYGQWPGLEDTGTGATAHYSVTSGTPSTYPPTQQNVSEAIFADLDPGASLVVTVRVGFEVTTSPVSSYIGQLGTPLMNDEVAHRSYQAIAREMLAAYPADYNLFGALFNVIKGIGQKILPNIPNAIGSLLKGKTSPIADNASPTVATPVKTTLPAGKRVQDDHDALIDMINRLTARVDASQRQPVKIKQRRKPIRIARRSGRR